MEKMSRRFPWIAHADWSVHSKKRWVAYGEPTPDGYVVSGPERVGDPETFLEATRRRAGDSPLIVGFDFPIGLPAAYAAKAGVSNFPAFLSACATGSDKAFFEIADTAQEIGLNRPFYPRGTRDCRRTDLFDGLGLQWDQLLRQCERATATRPAACALFWTLGGNQVGRGALDGWRNVLMPALARRSIALWPFEGQMTELLSRPQAVVVETYPADAVRQLMGAPLGRWSKRKRADRQRIGPRLFPEALNMRPSVALEADLRDGFGDAADGEDRFDAVTGAAALCQWALNGFPDEPTDPVVRLIEGWIAGQGSS